MNDTIEYTMNSLMGIDLTSPSSYLTDYYVITCMICGNHYTFNRSGCSRCNHRRAIESYSYKILNFTPEQEVKKRSKILNLI